MTLHTRVNINVFEYYDHTTKENEAKDNITSIALKRYIPNTDPHRGWTYKMIYNAYIPYQFDGDPIKVGPNHPHRDENGMLSLRHVLKVAFEKFNDARKVLIRDTRQGGSEADVSSWDF